MGVLSDSLEKDPFDRNIAYRIGKNTKEYKDRQNFVFSIGYCQICGSEDLDSPHHALDGISRKDDRTMICICCSCHRTVHNKGFETLPLTEEEVVEIGWENNENYLHSKGLSCTIK